MNAEQKSDLNCIFPGWKNAGNLDYVTCWYKKCADLMRGTSIRSALVSTNSVTQGESVANLWKPLFEMGVHIDFAHRTFHWAVNAFAPDQNTVVFCASCDHILARSCDLHIAVGQVQGHLLR